MNGVRIYLIFVLFFRSPGASDIVSPASGFSDSESDIGSQIPIYCPAHGPIPLIPVRYLNRHFPLLPAVQEQAYQSDTYDEGGSTYSSGQNSDQLMICSNNVGVHHLQQSSEHLLHANNKMCNSAVGIVNEWRLRRGVQRSDAIYISDDGKSSIASSPGRICPRCMEKERDQVGGGRITPNAKSTLTEIDDTESDAGGNMNNLDGHGGGHVSTGIQFDSGIIDVGDCSVIGDSSCGGAGGSMGGGGGGTVKNVSFETCTSSDSAISTKGSRSVSWNRPCTTVSFLPSRLKHSNNVIEEVTSQSQNSNSSVGSGGGGGMCGTNQGIQTDLPSPPPSTTSQDDNNTLIDEIVDDQQHHPCSCMVGNNNGGGNISGGGGGGIVGGGRTSSAFCVTVTTFGVTPSGGGSGSGGTASAVPTTAKATDV